MRKKAENQRKSRENSKVVKTKCFGWISAPKKRTVQTPSGSKAPSRLPRGNTPTNICVASERPLDSQTTVTCSWEAGGAGLGANTVGSAALGVAAGEETSAKLGLCMPWNWLGVLCFHLYDWNSLPMCFFLSNCAGISHALLIWKVESSFFGKPSHLFFWNFKWFTPLQESRATLLANDQPNIKGYIYFIGIQLHNGA